MRAFHILGVGVLLAAVAAFYFHQPDSRQNPPPQIFPAAPVAPEGNPSPVANADSSTPANLEMAEFRKAVHFIETCQEPAGNWKPDIPGADATLDRSNAAISLTALATMTVSSAIQGRSPNAGDVAAARKGFQWLVGMQRPDGRIAAVSEPDSVEAQFLAALAFMRAGELSGRQKFDDAARSAVAYAFQNTMATRGGFGPVPRAETSQAGLTALGALVYQTAAANEYHFGGKLDVEVERALKAGLSHVPSDWASTVAAISAKVLLLASPEELQPEIEFVMRDYDPRVKVFSSMNWGAGGAGYSSQTLWQAGTAFRQLYGEDAAEWRVWKEQIQILLLPHQSADGAWPVAGPDARRGRVWRASFAALTLLLTQPTLPQTGNKPR